MIAVCLASLSVCGALQDRPTLFQLGIRLADFPAKSLSRLYDGYWLISQDSKSLTRLFNGRVYVYEATMGRLVHGEEEVKCVGQSHKPIVFSLWTTSQASYWKPDRTWVWGGTSHNPPVTSVNEHTMVVSVDTGPIKGGGTLQGVGIVYLEKRGPNSPNKLFLFGTNRMRVYKVWAATPYAGGWNVLTAYYEKKKPEESIIDVFHLTPARLKRVSARDRSNPASRWVGMRLPSDEKKWPMDRGYAVGVDFVNGRALYFRWIDRPMFEYDLASKELARVEPPNGLKDGKPAYAGGMLLLNGYSDAQFAYLAKSWRLYLASPDRRSWTDLGPYRIHGSDPFGKLWLLEGPKPGQLFLFRVTN